MVVNSMLTTEMAEPPTTGNPASLGFEATRVVINCWESGPSGANALKIEAASLLETGRGRA